MNINRIFAARYRDENEADCIYESKTNNFSVGLANNGSISIETALNNVNRSNTCDVSQGSADGHKMEAVEKPPTNRTNRMLLLNPTARLRSEKSEPNTNADSFNQTSASFDEVDLINLDELSFDEEDSWLYRSPQRRRQSVTPYNWVRQDFDHTENHFTHSGCSLLQQLNSVIQSKGGFDARRYLEEAPVAKNSYLKNNTSLSLNTKAALKDDPKQLDTRTYAKNQTVEKLLLNNKNLQSSLPKPSDCTDQSERKSLSSMTYDKKRLMAAAVKARRCDSESSSSEVDVLNASSGSCTVRKNGSEEMVDSRWQTGTEGIGGSLDDCLNDVGKHKVADVTDVQLLAKMQEDSLRQSFSSTPKRSRKSELNKSTGHLLEAGLGGHGIPLYRSAHSSPHRTYDLVEMKNSTNGMASSSSESCSPPESQTNISMPLSKLQGVVDVHKRSLPNLSKANKLGLFPSDDEMCDRRESIHSDGSLEDSMLSQLSHRSGLKKLTQGSSASTSPTPRGSLLPSRSAVSTPKSGIPSPKVTTGIPRPNAVSKLRPPSKIGGVKKAFTTPAQNDSSWREGCF